MNKFFTRTTILSLLSVHIWTTAYAAVGPLDSIDSRLVFDNFRLETSIGVDAESSGSQSIPGCVQVKSFQVFESNVPGEIVVAMCEKGELGPSNIEVTLAKRVADAKKSLKNMSSSIAHSMLAGVQPVTVSLGDGNQGKALTLPYVGHGFALIPLAYAITPRKNATIVVQAYLNPNAPRNLTAPTAALLQAIYKRLQQSKK